VIEPHYHQNAGELIYCIAGAAIVSILNPFTKKLQNYPIKPGWWHYEVATEDDTHLLAIFDAPTPEVILGSDILRFTPSNIMAHTYCLDENLWKKAIAPVVPSTYIGPSKDCNRVKSASDKPKDSNHCKHKYQYPQYTNPYSCPHRSPYMYPYGGPYY